MPVKEAIVNNMQITYVSGLRGVSMYTLLNTKLTRLVKSYMLKDNTCDELDQYLDASIKN